MPSAGLKLPAEALRRARQTGILTLPGYHLTVLPPEIGQLAQLHTLDLVGNHLTTLPPEIVQFTHLQTLNLVGNHLTTLPPEIGQLTQLHTLDLMGNHLTTLPPEIGQLTQLKVLDLFGNRVTALPPQIGQLTQLQALDLSRNRLTGVPPEIGQLTRLRKLALEGNALTTLPAGVCLLKSLQVLDLTGNWLAALPSEIGRLTHLQFLVLTGNVLKALPPEIGQLTSLQVLKLGGNRLAALPTELADLLDGALQIGLGANPLDDPFAKSARRGNHSLATYLRSLTDASPHYEAKMLLVGEGGVGKTSLLAALAGLPFVEGREPTHGIEIHPLAVKHPDHGAEMTVRAWDFGGQEVYRITSQFFITRRALYLVTWNARHGQEQDDVLGWLRRIRLRVGREVRTLLVATHCEECHPELDYPRLKEEFPDMLAGQHGIDSLSELGIDNLRSAIAAEAAGLPQMGQLISSRWAAARDEILALAAAEPQVSFSRFAAICRRHQVDGQEIPTLAELLHDLGHIIYHSDDEGLRDFVVLNPEWLSKAISRVLDDAQTRQAGGILDHARLREIWGEGAKRPGYPERTYPYFLRLMEKFDVCYRLDNDDYHSLVAQLVPPERPELPWHRAAPLVKGTRQLALLCQLSEPPPGLVAWLTVRHHRATTGKHWRSGVFLRHPIPAYASEALIDLRHPTELALTVRAPSPELFFHVLRDSVEDLLIRRWPGLRYELHVPCPTLVASGQPCSGTFPLAGLRHLRERGHIDTVPCMVCGELHEITRLLTGYPPPASPIQPALDRLHNDIVAVQAGISRLERYAADTADTIRRLLIMVGTEITDCPRLFTITPATVTGARRLRAWQHHYQLNLWCEHPDYWHAWPKASYSIDEPKEWLARIGPYATLIARTLQIAAPIAAALAGAGIVPGRWQHDQDQIQLMTTLISALPDQLPTDGLDLPDRADGQLTAAQGQAARILRATLFKLDPDRAFGDLRRVNAPSGEVLWVCPEHYPSYDPGLPLITGPSDPDHITLSL